MKKLIILFLLFVTPLYATVSTGESIREYFTLGAATTEFLFLIPANSSDDIQVYKHLISTGVETPLVEDTDYTIIATGGDYRNGGTVTISPALGVTFQVVIVRSIKKSQETASGAITPTSIVAALDKIARTVQDLQDRNDRSIHLQESDGTGFDMSLPGKDERAGFLFFDDDGIMTFTANLIADSISASAFGTSLVQAADALAARVLLELTTTDAVQFAAITGTTGTFSGAISATAGGFSDDVTMATGKVLTTEIIRAVDATGILIQNDTPATVITIQDDGTALLADGATATTQAASDNSTLVATTAYVDAQVDAGKAASVSMSSYTVKDSDNNNILIAQAYLAATDGFVAAYQADHDNLEVLTIYVGNTDDPAGAGDIIQQFTSASDNRAASLFCAVQEGEFFEVTHSGSTVTVIRWMSLGALSEPVDQD